MRCLIRSWTFFWLVDGKVTGWCFRNLSILVPASLSSSACDQHVVPFLTWVRVLVSAEMLKDMDQIVIYISFRRNQESCDSLFLIINCLSQYFGTWERPGDWSIFLANKKQGQGKTLYRGGLGRCHNWLKGEVKKQRFICSKGRLKWMCKWGVNWFSTGVCVGGLSLHLTESTCVSISRSYFALLSVICNLQSGKIALIETQSVMLQGWPHCIVFHWSHFLYKFKW